MFIKPKVLIFGFGYVANFLSKFLIQHNYDIFVTSRNISIAKSRYFDIPDDVRFIDFSSVHTDNYHAIFSCIPPSSSCDPVLKEYSKVIQSANWIGYLSSTGVYGNKGGDWVSEDSECNPTNKWSIDRYKIEKQWKSLGAHIFRLSGIYGPGRNYLEQIRNGKKFNIIKNDHFFSRIHVVDICNVLLRAMSIFNPGAIYNVSDDEPAPSHVVCKFASELLGISLQEMDFEHAELSDRMIGFYNDNKKVDNSKIKNIFQLSLNYPNYRIGLQKGCL